MLKALSIRDLDKFCSGSVSFIHRKCNALVRMKILDKAIATAAKTGESIKPLTGNRAPAATGTKSMP